MQGRLRTEIGQQPQAMRDLMEAYARRPAPLDAAADAVRRATRGGRAVFTGMGSSYFAGYAATCRLWQHGVPALCVEAGELLHYGTQIVKRDDTVVLVSQSGRTVEIVKLLDLLAGRATIVGVTNEPDSTLGRGADVLLPLHAGREEMSTTKTYTNTLLVLWSLVQRVCGAEDSQFQDDVSRLPDLAEAFIGQWDRQSDELADLVDGAALLDLVARGPAFATAMQSAVILKEGAHVLAEALTGATFRHGPIEIAGPSHAAVVFAPQGPGLAPSMVVTRDLARLGSRTVLLTNAAADDLPATVLRAQIPASDEFMFTILSAIPLELLIVAIARRKGLEAGALTVGNKVTAKE